MRLRSPRHLSALLVLAVAIFTALPRTLFHRCHEQVVAWTAPGDHPEFHADGHCPICEAPVPVCDGCMPVVQVPAQEVSWSEETTTDAPLAAASTDAPRLRGPPDQA